MDHQAVTKFSAIYEPRVKKAQLGALSTTEHITHSELSGKRGV